MKVHIGGKSLIKILGKNSMFMSHRSEHCRRQCGDQEEDNQNLIGAKYSIPRDKSILS